MISIIELRRILLKNYLIEATSIEKSEESTSGNVYIIYSNTKKYVVKLYEDINHTKSMISLYNDLSDKFYIPKIIKSKNNESYIKVLTSKYIILYSFLDGIQIGKKFDALDEVVVKEIALTLRQLHNLTNNINKYNLSEVSFINSYKLDRKSLLHFDLTKGNIFYDNGKIGFIDFDDAKYGASVCDVAIIIALLFFTKKKGIDNENMNIFIDTYYGADLLLKSCEIKYIKPLAIDWINYTLENNEFNNSTLESFEIKKKLIFLNNWR